MKKIKEGLGKTYLESGQLLPGSKSKTRNAHNRGGGRRGGIGKGAYGGSQEWPAGQRMRRAAKRMEG